MLCTETIKRVSRTNFSSDWNSKTAHETKCHKRSQLTELNSSMLIIDHGIIVYILSRLLHIYRVGFFAVQIPGKCCAWAISATLPDEMQHSRAGVGNTQSCFLNFTRIGLSCALANQKITAMEFDNR